MDPHFPVQGDRASGVGLPASTALSRAGRDASCNCTRPHGHNIVAESPGMHNRFQKPSTGKTRLLSAERDETRTLRP